MWRSGSTIPLSEFGLVLVGGVMASPSSTDEEVLSAAQQLLAGTPMVALPALLKMVVQPVEMLQGPGALV